MNLHEYVPLAVRTESRINNIVFNKSQLYDVLTIAILASNIADMVKKNVFYGKQISQDKWYENLHSIQEIAQMQLFAPPGGYPDVISATEINPRLFHSAIGLFTESGELLEALRKGSVDAVNFREELGDAEWYQAIGYDELKADPEANLQNNIDKLRKRFPNKFEQDRAINRDLDGEREILESGEAKSTDGC